MTKNFAISPLKRVIEPVERPEIPIPGQEYRQIGVQLWGRGAYEREPLDGGQTKYKTLSRVEKDDIIVNKIWARNGSVAVVPPSLSGCYASNEFPTFRPIPDQLEPRWFHWFSKTSSFWHQCDEKSRGTSGKNRIRPDRFLEIEIPLPHIAEQRRIVARIEELSAKIEEARNLRHQTSVEAETLWSASLRRQFARHGCDVIALEQACASIIDNLHSNPRYADAGVPCVRSPDVGWGTLGLETALKTDKAEYHRRTIRGEPQPDDIVLVREGGGTGKAAIVLQGQRFSLGQRVMMLRPDKHRVVPRFFLYQLLSPLIQQDHIVPLSKGSASPHLNIGALRKFPFRLPPLSDQRRIVAYLDDLQAKIGSLTKLQEESEAELDALMPSILSRAFAGEL